MEEGDTKTEGAEPLKIIRTSDHRSHYAIGALTQWSEHDLRVHFFNEVIEGAGGPYFVSTAQVILPKGGLAKLIEALSNARLTEGDVRPTKVAKVPKELSFISEREAKERMESDRKKVKKIRRA
jgi:hypothetical protein